MAFLRAKKRKRMEANITRELIFEHFANKVTPLQRRQIDDWLQTEENEELYYKWLEEWESSNPEYQPDSERLVGGYVSYIRTHPRQDDQPAGALPGGRFRLPRKWWTASIAAAVALLLITAGIWLNRGSLYYKTYETSNGEVRRFVLMDGSLVTLNARSQLRVPRWGFGTSSREVVLDGEAGFTVRHTPDHRKFVVTTGKGFEVVVLGTEFSVFSRSRGARVVLNRGSVKINYQEGNATKQLLMKPGELVSFDPRNRPTLSQASTLTDLSIWQEKRFVFEQTRLSEVAQMLEETYGLKVEISSPQLAERELMGSFRANNLDELLQTISDLLDIAIVREADTIRLSEK
jgi:transmembrane sensor